MNTAEAELVTRKHIHRVNELLIGAAMELLKRATVHDLSKLEMEELEPLQKMQDLIAVEGHASYGSEEYKRRTEMLGPMLKHHYANNSHHPEHYENGVNGMDLFDVMEMFFDWKAASERSEESSIGVSASVDRFKIEPQLEQIIRNTAAKLGYRAA